MLYHCHYPHICFIQAHYVSNINDIASGVQGNQFASSRANTMYIYNLQSTAVLLLWIKVSVRLWELRCLRFFASLCHSWQNKKNKMHDTETARFVLLRDDKHVKTLHRQTQPLMLRHVLPWGSPLESFVLLSERQSSRCNVFGLTDWHISGGKLK